MDGRSHLQPGGDIVGVIRAHISPDAVLAFLLAPFLLVLPASRRDKNVGRVSRGEFQRRLRAFLVVVIRLSLDLGVSADFPARMADRHEGIPYRCLYDSIPTTELNTFAGAKSDVLDGSGQRSQGKPTQELWQLRLSLAPLRPDSH